VTVPDIPPGFDFTDPEIYTTRVPAEEFAELRRRRPGLVGEPAPRFGRLRRRGVLGGPPGTPTSSPCPRRPTSTRRRRNTALIRFQGGASPASPSRCSGSSCSTWTPPQHTRMRGIVSRGFTPRAISNMRQVLAERAERIVATALESGHRGLRRRRGVRVAAAGHQRPESASRRRTGARSSPGPTG